MKQRFTAKVWREGEWYVAQCRQFEIASQGASTEEALENLSEAISLHFEPPVATILPEVLTVEPEVEDEKRGIA